MKPATNYNHDPGTSTSADDVKPQPPEDTSRYRPPGHDLQDQGVHLPALKESKPVTTPHLSPYMLKVEETELVTLPHPPPHANVDHEQPRFPQIKSNTLNARNFKVAAQTRDAKVMRLCLGPGTNQSPQDEPRRSGYIPPSASTCPRSRIPSRSCLHTYPSHTPNNWPPWNLPYTRSPLVWSTCPLSGPSSWAPTSPYLPSE